MQGSGKDDDPEDEDAEDEDAEDSGDDKYSEEDGDTEEDEDDGGQREDEDDYADRIPWRHLTRWTNRLNLNIEDSHLAEAIIAHADVMHELATQSGVAIVAASLYLGSHLRRQPLSLEEIFPLAGITRCAIQNVYREIHADRFDLIDEEQPELFDMPNWVSFSRLCALYRGRL